MRQTIYTYATDNQDGSYSVKLFLTKAELEAYVNEDEEAFGYATDSEGTIDLVINDNKIEAIV